MGSKGSNTVSQNQVTTPYPGVTAAGQQALTQAQTAAASPFQQPAAPVAPFSGQQQQAFGAVGNEFNLAQPYFNTASNLVQQAAQPVSAQDVARYYNPMAGNVTAQLENIFGQQQQNVTGQLTQAAGGVGADRIAVGQSELANQQGLAAGQTYAGLYQQALQAAQQQQQTGLAAGYGMGNLGAGAQGAALQGAGALLNTGGLQQQETQALLNSPYQQTLASLAYPFQTAQFLAGVTGGVGGVLGSNTQATTTYPPPNPISQALGLGVAGAGIYGQAGGFSGAGKGAGGGGYNPESAFGGYNVTGLGPAGLPMSARGGRQMATGGGTEGLEFPSKPSLGHPNIPYGELPDDERHYQEWKARQPKDPRFMADGGDPGNAAQPGIEAMSAQPYGEDKFPSVVPNIQLTPHPLQAPRLPSVSSPGGGGSGGSQSGIMGDIGAGIKLAATVAPLFLAADGGAVDTVKSYLSGLGSLTTKDEPIGLGVGGLRGAQGGAVGPFTALQGFASGGSPYDDMFSAKEQQYGLPSGYLRRTARIESSNNPRDTNAHSGAAGLFQFIPSTARQYGLGNPYDPAASTDAAARLAAANRNYLKAGLGRDPTAGELYLAHQQGPNGAIRLLTNPNAPATALVGSAPVLQNGGHPGMTGGEFASKWTNQFEGDGGGYGSSGGDGGGGIHMAFNNQPSDDRQQAGKDFSSSPWAGVTKLGLDMYNKASTFARGGMAAGGEPDDEEPPPPMPNPDNPNDPEPPPEEQGARYAGLAGPVPYPTADIKSPGQDFARSPWAALTTAGLAIAAGKSPFALSNIGAGGLEGMKTLEKQRTDIREEQATNLRAKALMQQAQFHADEYGRMKPGEKARLDLAKSHQALEKYKIDKDTYFPPVPTPYGDGFFALPKREGLPPRYWKVGEDGTIKETTGTKDAPVTPPVPPGQPQQQTKTESPDVVSSIAPPGARAVSDDPDAMGQPDQNVAAAGAKRNPDVARFISKESQRQGYKETADSAKELNKAVEAAQLLDTNARGMQHNLDVLRAHIQNDPTGKLRAIFTPGMTGEARREVVIGYNTAMKALGRPGLPEDAVTSMVALDKDSFFTAMRNLMATGVSARETQQTINAARNNTPSFSLPEDTSRYMLATMEQTAQRQRDRMAFFNAERGANGNLTPGWEDRFNRLYPPSRYIAQAIYSVMPQDKRAELKDSVSQLRGARDAYLQAEKSGDQAAMSAALAKYNKGKSFFDQRYNGLGNYFMFGIM